MKSTTKTIRPVYITRVCVSYTKQLSIPLSNTDTYLHIGFSPLIANDQPGELELDEEHPVWERFDYDDWGPQPVDMLEDYPEGAMWSCCQKQGTKKGCVRGLHINAEEHELAEAKKLKV